MEEEGTPECCCMGRMEIGGPTDAVSPPLLSDFKSTDQFQFIDGNGQRHSIARPPAAMEDSDLDSAALWAAVDYAAAKVSTRVRGAASDDDHRGEVLQPARPFKSPRLASASHATPPSPSPSPLPLPLAPPTHASPYATSDSAAAAAAAARNRLAVVESPPPQPWWFSTGSPITTPNDGGLLPSLSVDNFRKYQEVALSILEKSD
ncbi:uncharacterized protein LOC120658414 isoform X2 [Panicum virgatum]|uniref:uncharacterized protein LOC120658414 isoform X2 n=1 Tax=Panicum virgatum TaxID=38727 RepID=UPI0019D63DC1|nr:uncharacterized protein LOC120658414 isoform X2 [Panicum virgatum]